MQMRIRNAASSRAAYPWVLVIATLAWLSACDDGDSGDPPGLPDGFGDTQQDVSGDADPADAPDPDEPDADEPDTDEPDAPDTDEPDDTDTDTDEPLPGDPCCPDDEGCAPEDADPDACVVIPDIDCEVSDWDEWTICSAVCGPGERERRRTVIVQPSGEGEACPDLLDTEACEDVPCPVPCILGDWQAWSTCSEPCGGGTQSRDREIVQSPAFGADPCPGPLTQTRTCNNQLCAVDCEMSEWSEWSECSRSCGSGQQTREREILVPAVGSGASCGSTQENRSCNLEPCPEDCQVGDWSEWSSCPSNCQGDQVRTRPITSPQLSGGEPCPALEERRACDEPLCVADCLASDFSPWSTCSAECGGGTQTRARTVIIPPTESGEACPELVETRTCNTEPCVAVDCVVSEWQPASSCDVLCGGGTRTFTRTILTQPQFGGAACPALSETRTCNEAPCPIDCEVSPWTEWSTCSETCGGGEQTRTRTVDVPAQFGGRVCPPLSETRECNDFDCPVDCEVSDWGAWTDCSETCGGGTRLRTREVVTDPEGDGQGCPPLVESEDCNTDLCPVDCEVGDWGSFSACSVSCGGGERTRTRPVLVAPVGDGAACPALSETEPCNETPCVTTDCEVSEWEPWSDCSSTCGEGIRTRERAVLVEPTPDGEQCPTLFEVEACNDGPCPIDCVYSSWGGWSTCTAACAGGEQTRNRTILIEAEFGGQACDEPLTQTRACNEAPCPVDCEVGDWDEWDACSAACDGGTQTRTRPILTPPSNGGLSCPETEESRMCNEDPCPRDCEVSDWSEWSSCSASCGGGTQVRDRFIEVDPVGDGEACPELSEFRACNTQDCPRDCEVGPWIQVQECTGTCEEAFSVEEREIIAEPVGDGAACPTTLTRQLPCVPITCPVDCVVSEWSGWTFCSETCERERIRVIEQAPRNGGEPCPPTREVESCTGDACPDP